MFDRVEDDLQWELGFDISPKYLGDDLVLFPELSKEGAEAIMNGRAHGNESFFHSLERWNPSIRTGNRLVWIQCWGIPIQAWDKKHIGKIVAVMGELMNVDEDVIVKRRLDRARVLIKTPWKPMIKHIIDVHISGDIFSVHAIEECGVTTCDNHSSDSIYQGSSEETASDDESSFRLRSPAPSHQAAAADDQGRDTATGHHLLPAEIVDAGKWWGNVLHSGQSVEDERPRVNNSDSRVLTTGKTKQTVNSSPEEDDINEACENHQLTIHDLRDCKFHENSMREKGESSGIQKQVLVHPRDYEDDTPLAGKRDVYQKQGGADVANKKGENKDKQPNVQYGPQLGLTSHSFYESETNSGHTPLNHVEKVNTWQVYSRGSWSKTKNCLGAIQKRDNYAVDIDKYSHGRDTAQITDIISSGDDTNKEINAVLEIISAHHQQAAKMWSMIKQLGVTMENEKEDQETRVIEQIRCMEDRDSREAERLGVMTNNP
ncbi:hypothetical protein AAZX31_08G267700 [Glycine max]